jgi:hypothetical protein
MNRRMSGLLSRSYSVGLGVAVAGTQRKFGDPALCCRDLDEARSVCVV